MSGEILKLFDQIDVQNYEVILVGSGTPTMAKGYHKDYIKNDKISCFCDQKLALFKAFECKYVGITDLLFNSSAFGSYTRGMGKGYMNGTTQGDGKQNGGVFVIADGKIKFQHVEQFAGHLPDWKEMLKCL
jgi:hypothetical protein